MNAKTKQGDLSRRIVLSGFGLNAGILADPPPVNILAQTIPGSNRIPIDMANLPLQCTIPQPTVEAPDDIIEPQIRRAGTTWTQLLETGRYIDLDNVIANRVWPLPMTIPISRFREELTPETPTEWEVRYIFWADGDNDGYSTIATFAIDLTAPYKVKQPPSDRKPAAAVIPDLGPSEKIDEDYIGSHPTGVPINIATYGNYEATDRVRVYWGLNPDPVVGTPVFEGLLPGSPHTVVIPISHFENSEEGMNSLLYVVTDIAGNVSRVSNPTARLVEFLDDPTTSLPPVVPLASGVGGDNLIDLADCKLGVSVQVTVPMPNVGTDSIGLFWGPGATVLKELPVSSAVGGILTFDVDYADIKAIYGDTDGDVATTVKYEMYRGPRKIQENQVVINVDVSYVGPDNPDAPDPVNPNLLAPTLLSFTGEDGIEPGDVGQPATISFKLFDAPPTQEGWLIDFNYDGVKIGDTIRLTVGQEGDVVSRQLLWDTILERGSGDKILQYSLYTSVNPNPTYSLPFTVVVQNFPIETPAPEIQRLPPSNRITCPTMNFGESGDGTARRNMEVKIPKSAYTLDGETITVRWRGETRDTPPVLIPGTEATATHDITGAYPDDGVIVEIGNYLTHFKPAHNQNGRVTYTITQASGTDTPPSEPAVHEVDFDNSELQFCEEVHPPTR